MPIGIKKKNLSKTLKLVVRKKKKKKLPRFGLLPLLPELTHAFTKAKTYYPSLSLDMVDDDICFR